MKFKTYTLLLFLMMSVILVGCGKTNDETPSDELTMPEDGVSYSDDIMYVRQHSMVTGDESINADLLQLRGIGGTDLGIPFYDGKQMYILFGDTFSGKGSHSGFWWSNFVAKSTDFDLTDGLLFDDIISVEDSDMTKPLIQGNHQQNVFDGENGATADDGREVTKIPTGGIAIGDTLYVFYMSVRYWGLPGEWKVNYNTVIKSTDEGQNWTEVEQLKWTESDAPNFAQIYPVKDHENEDIIYLYGIPGGRSGGAKLMKVHKDDFLDFDAYEYYTGLDDDNQPIWVQGSEGLQTVKDSVDSYVIAPPVGELNIMYNDYLDKWLATYQKGSNIIFKTADNPWGPWSRSEVITKASDYPGLYGAFTHPLYTTHDGQRIYFLMSLWLPTYNVTLMEMAFK